jgi:hypothetical protein
MLASNDYVKSYQTAKKELSDLIASLGEMEKRIVLVRQFLQTVAAMCENEGIHIDPSAEASHLLKHSTLADEIRAILKSVSPDYVRPNEIKCNLKRLGHDLTKYRNSQATIQMVLKRMTDSGEVQEGTTPENGKKRYRFKSWNFDDVVENQWNKLKDKRMIDK